MIFNLNNFLLIMLASSFYSVQLVAKRDMVKQ